MLQELQNLIDFEILHTEPGKRRQRLHRWQFFHCLGADQRMVLGDQHQVAQVGLVARVAEPVFALLVDANELFGELLESAASVKIRRPEKGILHSD